MKVKKHEGQGIYATIFIAGDINVIKQACREFCMSVGLCVNIKEVDFIYTAGEEHGAEIGLINYMRFPSSEEDLLEKAERLGEMIMERACQRSFSVLSSTKSIWFEREQ